MEGYDEEARLVADGYSLVTGLPARDDDEQTLKRFASIVIIDWCYVGGTYAKHAFTDARLVAEPDGTLRGILPKGKRTQGARIASTANVYVR